MNLVVKVSGVILCSLSVMLIGFLKSISLKNRVNKLGSICHALDILYEHINYGEIPLEEALQKSFKDCNFIKVCGNEISLDDGDFELQDIQIIDSFFKDLGKSGKKAECERICAIAAILRKEEVIAQKSALEKAKLWQTGGVCLGLIIAILLI